MKKQFVFALLTIFLLGFTLFQSVFALTTLPATNISDTSATLNSYVDADEWGGWGGVYGQCECRFMYRLVSEGLDMYTPWIGVLQPGDYFSAGIGGLEPGETYLVSAEGRSVRFDGTSVTRNERVLPNPLDGVFFQTLGETPLPPEQQPPVASFTYSPETQIVGGTIEFDASDSDDPDGTIMSYEWDFDDGTYVLGDAIITHNYTQAGWYTVTLTVMDNDGLQDDSSKSIVVGSKPVAEFTYPSRVDGKIVPFDASDSYDPDGGEIDQYIWDFGGGNIQEGKVIGIMYLNPGLYTVKLMVIDDEMQTGSIEKYIPILIYDDKIWIPNIENVKEVADKIWRATFLVEGFVMVWDESIGLISKFRLFQGIARRILLHGLKKLDPKNIITSIASSAIPEEFYAFDQKTRLEMEKSYKAIADDPPDSNYTEIAEIESIEMFEFVGDISYEVALVNFINNMAENEVVLKALLTSIERFQGALLANDPEYTYLQVQAVRDYSDMMAGSLTSLDYSFDQLIQEFQVLESDPNVSFGLEEMQQRLITQGLTQEEIEYFKSLGATDSEIEEYKEMLLAFDISDLRHEIQELKEIFVESISSYVDLSAQALNIILSGLDYGCDIVIGDFENDMDNWVAEWEGSAVLGLSNNPITVTSGSQSLSVKLGGQGYWALRWNAPTVPRLKPGTTLQFDVTMIQSEWTQNNWTRVANNIAIHSDGPSGWKEFFPTAIDRVTGQSTSLDWESWNPDALKTYSVDISSYDATGATWFQINISLQQNPVNGSGYFYIDNVQLLGPSLSQPPVWLDNTMYYVCGLYMP